MDSRQQQTTSSGLRGNRGRYTLESPPPAAHVSFADSILGKRYGNVEIISKEKRWSQTWNRCYVLTQCVHCGATQWTDFGNLRTGKSKGCQSCSQPRQIPKWLDRRLTAAKQRCENPNAPEYKNYGARGIHFDFVSVTAAGLWMIENLGLPDRKMEIDRIDTNGNYAPGNLRWATRSENNSNTRRTVLSEYDPQYWPYAYGTVIRKLSAGYTREEIIEQAELAVEERRKNWRGIADRLASMTYEMPDHIIVLPYRESSSTTADTEVA